MMRILDLFSGGGGAAMGYHRAGFEVVGVDHEAQPHYPFPFLMMDALEAMRRLISGDCLQFERDGEWIYGMYLHDFDAIHASPPCQCYIRGLAELNRLLGRELKHMELINPIRELLRETRLPYVIENGIHAPLIDAVQLCGSSFGLKVRRHRKFETNWLLMGLPCNHERQRNKLYPCSFGRAGYRNRMTGTERPLSTVVQVYGKSKGRELWPDAMGIDWMTGDELSQAAPPAYTEWIGSQLITQIERTI